MPASRAAGDAHFLALKLDCAVSCEKFQHAPPEFSGFVPQCGGVKGARHDPHLLRADGGIVDFLCVPAGKSNIFGVTY